MNYLAPLTLLAALISTALIFTPATAHANSLLTIEELPLLNGQMQTPLTLPSVKTPLRRPDVQVVNDNLAFSYEYRPALTPMTQVISRQLAFITLPHISFGHNGIKLTPKATEILNGAAQYIFENDNTIKRILINGHSNDIADKYYNYRLSDSRAYAVWDYLAGKGIRAELMVVKGWGESRPIDENWTRAGRQRNRHVEIQIVQVKSD